MDVRSVIRQRLRDLGLEQRDLAAAAQVTESYISQLLTGRKLPPAPERTDIYPKMEKALKVSPRWLSDLAEVERREELKKHLGEPPLPLLKELRELVLRKCAPGKESEVRAIFEKDPFGELENFITQKLLDVTKKLVKLELENETWLRVIARSSGRQYEELRVLGLEFLDTDVFNVSVGDCAAFLNPLLESWNIDLTTFALEVQLSRRLVPDHIRRFEFIETEPAPAPEEYAGLEEFLRDEALSGDASEEEVGFLRRLRLQGRRPTALYYYRELQNLRDPIHFAPTEKRSRRGTGNLEVGR